MNEYEEHEIAGVYRLLHGEEFSALVADIAANGLIQPIYLYEGKILDGRNRYRACKESGVTPDFLQYEGDDPMGFVHSANDHRRHNNESQRAMTAARMANLRQGARTDLEPSANLPEVSQSEAAKAMSVSERSLRTAAKVQANAAPEVLDAIDDGFIAVSDAQSIIDREDQAEIVEKAIANNTTVKAEARKADMIKQVDNIASGAISLPVGLFDLIDVDPPWPYKDGITQPDYDPKGHRASNPYPEMSLEEIAALPVPDHASADCVLWLWTTHKFMRHSFAILDAWGFQDRAIMTWAKDRMGLGRWMRSQSEFAIMATRGKPLINLTNQTTILNGPMREHSRKPDEFYSMVETLCPASRRLVWFGREGRAGWHVGGNEPEKFDAVA